jgi:hypothetical protein
LLGNVELRLNLSDETPKKKMEAKPQPLDGDDEAEVSCPLLDKMYHSFSFAGTAGTKYSEAESEGETEEKKQRRPVL